MILLPHCIAMVAMQSLGTIFICFIINLLYSNETLTMQLRNLRNLC